MKRMGVTVIELVVVLGIIGVLVAMFFPAINSIRARAKETVCQNNIRQINLAATMYLDGAKKLPAPSRVGFAEGWTLKFLPFMEQNNLSNSIPMDTLLANVAPEAIKQPESLRCPTRAMLGEESIDGIPVAHYVISGRHAVNGKGLSSGSCDIWDAPLSLKAPWLNSPEQNSFQGKIGPHSSGFYWARSRRNKVEFYIPSP